MKGNLQKIFKFENFNIFGKLKECLLVVWLVGGLVGSSLRVENQKV